MRIQELTSREVGELLVAAGGIVLLPTGSTEQHGSLGLCGTDALCAEAVAVAAAELVAVPVLPTLAYAPAQFNADFAGTVSLRAETFQAVVRDILFSLSRAGVRGVYVLNGHGANRAALDCAVHDCYAALDVAAPRVRVRSWWEYPSVDAMRTKRFGEWEGLHATPSEISITQHTHRRVKCDDFQAPVAPLSPETLRALGGDRHAPASLHRAAYPDGAVGADGSLATPEIGARLLEAAGKAAADELKAFRAELDAPLGNSASRG